MNKKNIKNIVSAKTLKITVTFIILIFAVLNVFNDIVFRTSAPDYFLVWSNSCFYKQGEICENIYEQEHKEKLLSFLLRKKSSLDKLYLKNIELRPDLNLCATPFFLTCFFKLTTSDSFADSRFIFGVISLLALLAGIFIFLRNILKQSWHVVFLISFVFLIFYDPLRISLNLGNINEVLFFVIVLLHILQSKSGERFRFFEGLLTALLIFFKPLFLPSVLLLFLLYLKSGKLKYYLCGFFAGSMMVILSSSSVLGLASWSDWLTYISTLDIAYWYDSVKWGNFSFSACLYGLLKQDTQKLTLIILMLLTTLYLLRQSRKDLERIQPVQLFWVGYFIFSLSSPLYWYHYHTLTFIPLLIVYFANEGYSLKVKRTLISFSVISFLVIGQFGNLIALCADNLGIALIIMFTANILLAAITCFKLKILLGNQDKPALRISQDSNT